MPTLAQRRWEGGREGDGWASPSFLVPTRSPLGLEGCTQDLYNVRSAPPLSGWRRERPDGRGYPDHRLKGKGMYAYTSQIGKIYKLNQTQSFGNIKENYDFTAVYPLCRGHMRWLRTSISLRPYSSPRFPMCIERERSVPSRTPTPNSCCTKVPTPRTGRKRREVWKKRRKNPACFATRVGISKKKGGRTVSDACLLLAQDKRAPV